MRKALFLFVVVIAMMTFFAGCDETTDLPANLVFTDEVVLGDLNTALPSGAYFDENGQVIAISMLDDNAPELVDFYFATDSTDHVALFKSSDQYGDTTFNRITGFMLLTGDESTVETTGYSDQVQITEDAWIAVQLQNNHYAKIHITALTPESSDGARDGEVTFEAWYNEDEGWTDFEYAPEETDE